MAGSRLIEYRYPLTFIEASAQFLTETTYLFGT